MTDSKDNKSKEKQNNLDVDLDAMLDDAESSLASMNESQDEEDTIDRLLMNAGFDSDDELTQPALRKDPGVVEDIGLHDELDDFLNFDDFADDSHEPEKTQAVAPLEQAVEDLSFAPSNEHQDDEDAIDRLLMNAGFGVDDEPMRATDDDISELKELDEFSDFSDFNEPEIDPVDEIEESELATESLSALANNMDLTAETDDADELDMIPENEIKASTPALTESEEPDVEDVVNTDIELDDFSDFSDFNEPDMIPAVEIDEPEQVTDNLSAYVDAAGLSDEVDDFSGLGDDFDGSDMILDDEDEAPAPTETESDQEQQVAVEESFSDLQDDENGIDRLLMDSELDAEDELEKTDGKKDVFGDDADLSEIAGLFQLDVATEDFAKKTEEDQLAETEQSTQDGDDFLLPDFDITADMEMPDTDSNAEVKEDDLADAFGGIDSLNEDKAVKAFESENAERKSGGDEAVFESQPKQAAGTAIEDVEHAQINPAGFEQEDIKKQLEDAENKVKKAKILNYVALGFGIVSLGAAAGLGVMTYGAKSEVSKLTEQVSTLEASLAKNAEKNPNEEINAVMNSVVQLNQQVYGFITQLKDTPQFPVDLLNNKVPDILAKQVMVSKALDLLQVKMGGVEGKMTIAEPAKVEAVHESAPAKVETTQEHVATKEKSAHDEIAPVKEKAKKEAAPAKVEVAPETAPAKAQAQPEAVPAKPITPPKEVLKEEPEKASKQSTAAAKWGINLVAFKQEWFAKSKAAEFARMGVFAEVIPVHEKNATLYRLRVGGFKSKAEAVSNTDRIRKALNLDSVWVSDN